MTFDRLGYIGLALMFVCQMIRGFHIATTGHDVTEAVYGAQIGFVLFLGAYFMHLYRRPRRLDTDGH